MAEVRNARFQRRNFLLYPALCSVGVLAFSWFAIAAALSEGRSEFLGDSGNVLRLTVIVGTMLFAGFSASIGAKVFLPLGSTTHVAGVGAEEVESLTVHARGFVSRVKNLSTLAGIQFVYTLFGLVLPVLLFIVGDAALSITDTRLTLQQCAGILLLALVSAIAVPAMSAIALVAVIATERKLIGVFVAVGIAALYGKVAISLAPDYGMVLFASLVSMVVSVCLIGFIALRRKPRRTA